MTYPRFPMDRGGDRTSTMKKTEKLIKKVKRLIKRLGCPRWLHHFGPKKYEFLHHLSALLVRFYSGLSLRRSKQLLDMLGFVCPSKSSLHRTQQKLDSEFWAKVLKITCPSSYLLAIDGTGFSKDKPSYHYLRRIDGKIPKIPVKLVAAFDVQNRKFVAAKIRVLPAHETRDVRWILRKSQPKILVADKAYDANWIHEYCASNDIEAHIPIRNKGKPRHGNFNKRMLASKHFCQKIYGQRALVEASFSSLKRKMGTSVSSKRVRSIRSELYGRMACHNLFGWLVLRFGTEPFWPEYL
jgi:hypothetical protein